MENNVLNNHFIKAAVPMVHASSLFLRPPFSFDDTDDELCVSVLDELVLGCGMLALKETSIFC